tara:strand:+ start:270 stop:740 length:471 start_codon:yes stop_codon:yes gene_type:complete
MNSFTYDGKHLMCDILTEEITNLNDPSNITLCLESIVETLDMTMILPPIIVKFPHSISELKRTLKSLEEEGLTDCKTARDIKNDLKQRQEEAYGYSAFVMIAESHISIHTFPELKYASFDCYSCKGFDETKVIEILKKFFDIVKIEAKTCKRGIPK